MDGVTALGAVTLTRLSLWVYELRDATRSHIIARDFKLTKMAIVEHLCVVLVTWEDMPPGLLC